MAANGTAIVPTKSSNESASPLASKNKDCVPAGINPVWLIEATEPGTRPSRSAL